MLWYSLYDSYFDVSLKKIGFLLNVSFFIAYLVIYTIEKERFMIEYYDKEELELQISNYLSGNSTDEEKETLLAFLATVIQLFD